MTNGEIAEITVEELNTMMQSGNAPVILDVREYFEFDLANIDGVLIPLGELEMRIYEIEQHKEDDIVVHCRTGSRSAEAVAMLQNQGFKKVKNLTGGLNEWARKIDSSLPIL